MAKSSLIAAGMLCVAFVGCATKPTSSGAAGMVPSERVLAYQSASADSGSLVIVRDSGFIGGQCFYGVSINGTLAGRFAVGEKATFQVPAGEVLLRSSRDPLGAGLCGFMKDEWTQRETIVRANETKYFRLSIDANGKTDIQRTDP